MATSPTQWLGGTEAHIVDLMLSELRTHLDGVWVDDATGTVHQLKATGMKEMEMRTVGTEGRTVKKRKVLLDACLAGGTRAHWDGRDLMTLAEGRCEWRARYECQSRGMAHVHALFWTKLQ